MHDRPLHSQGGALAHFFAKKSKLEKTKMIAQTRLGPRTTPANVDVQAADATTTRLLCASRTPRGGRSPGGALAPAGAWRRSRGRPRRLWLCEPPPARASGANGTANTSLPPPPAASSSFFQDCLPNPPQGRSLTLRAPPHPCHSLSSGSHHVCDSTRAQSSSMKK